MTKSPQFQNTRMSPCLVCKSIPSDPAHVKARGSGGSDDPFNIIPLCRTHHALQHLRGWSRFLEEFPQVRDELTQKGWSFDSLMGRFLMFHEAEKS